MNRPSPGLCVLLVGWLTAASSAKDVDLLQFAKPIERQPTSQEEILAIPLDADVYAATQDGLADIRILDPNRAELPFRIERATDTTVETERRPSPGAVRSLVTHDEDNRIEVLVELEKDALAADGLTVITPLENFERRVSVFGSDDGASWQPLATDTMIFDYSRFMDVANRDVTLPRNSFRRLKLVIRDVVDENASTLMELTRQFEQSDETRRTERSLIERRPLRIDRIDLWLNVPQQRVQKIVRADYPIVDFRVEENPEEKTTIVHVRTRREPLVQFTLETSSTNFSRSAAVEVPLTRGVTVTWTPIARATLSRVRFRDLQREQLAIEFDEQRQAEYRLVIANADNAPLEITGIGAQGHVYRVLMLAAPETNYQLCYGAGKVAAPRYDTAAIDVALAQGFAPVVATLGMQMPNPDFGGSRGFAPADWLDSPLFLGSAIALMVAVLGFLIYRASRHIEGISEEGSPPGSADRQ